MQSQSLPLGTYPRINPSVLEYKYSGIHCRVSHFHQGHPRINPSVLEYKYSGIHCRVSHSHQGHPRIDPNIWYVQERLLQYWSSPSSTLPPATTSYTPPPSLYSQLQHANPLPLLHPSIYLTTTHTLTLVVIISIWIVSISPLAFFKSNSSMEV